MINTDKEVLMKKLLKSFLMFVCLGLMTSCGPPFGPPPPPGPPGPPFALGPFGFWFFLILGLLVLGFWFFNHKSVKRYDTEEENQLLEYFQKRFKDLKKRLNEIERRLSNLEKH